MIRTTKFIQECKCNNCGIIHLLGETFQGQRCCDKPSPLIIGKREVPQYTKTIEEEKQEAFTEQVIKRFNLKIKEKQEAFDEFMSM